MSYELIGQLIEKFDINQISDNFKKREFVVEKTENSSGREFTEQIKFQLTQDRCALIDSFELNEIIKITFNIRGRKWEKDGNVSYFTNLEAWRIEKVSEQKDEELPPAPSDDDVPPETEDDDLPF